MDPLLLFLNPLVLLLHNIAYKTGFYSHHRTLSIELSVHTAFYCNTTLDA